MYSNPAVHCEHEHAPALDVRPGEHCWQRPPATENWLARHGVQVVALLVDDEPHWQSVHLLAPGLLE